MNTDKTERQRRHWDRHARGYDKQIGWLEQRYFPRTRGWVCGQARGHVLEVAVGTGLNLPFYPDDVSLTGVDVSPEMLAIARQRAERLGRSVTLRRGDAQALDLSDASFDTVVCTFSLCTIPDEQRAVHEMVRVLRPGGLLLLADHAAGATWWMRGLQLLVDAVTVPTAGEHYRRRPIRHIEPAGLRIERHDRFAIGVIEQLAARKPASA